MSWRKFEIAAAAAAAAAKSCQSCPTLCDPIDSSPSDFQVIRGVVINSSLGFSRQEYWSGLPFPSPKFETKVLKNNIFHLFVAFLVR